MSQVERPQVEIHGYAIVSDNDCIADASGQTPSVLRNEADGSPWHRLQQGVIQTASYTFRQYDLRRWE